MWYENVGTSFFRFVTKHAFDRWTDGRTERQHSHGYAVQSHGKKDIIVGALKYSRLSGRRSELVDLNRYCKTY